MAAGPDPDWLALRRLAAARALRRAVSATDLSHERPGFGWTVRPAPGSILASPFGAAWDPEPDYFHHWVRDAAIAVRAVPLAIEADPGSALFWHQAMVDHIKFSLAISDPARCGPSVNPLKGGTAATHRQYLRPDAELAGLTGDAWLGEPRCAPDGGPDPERWSRPQFDGPALRASALIHLLKDMPDLDGPDAHDLIRRDLAFTHRTAGMACIGPWEEESARRSTFTLIAQWDALDRGASWGGMVDDSTDARANLLRLIEDTADPETGGWRESIEAPPGHLDSAAVLAILHADRWDGPLAIGAERTLATVETLEATFASIYPINQGRPVPAMGRWKEDVFFGGNPWYPVTLGFAELHYRLAVLGQAGAFEKAESWMALIEQVAPEGDDLPEQFDRATGRALSSPALTWSSAAFLGAASARDVALQTIG